MAKAERYYEDKMSFYNDRENVESYVKMAEGYDGREVIELLKHHLKPKSTVLELGMGPGVDLEILSETYRVTGSDFSEIFLNRYRKTNPDADLIQLDAVSMETERAFDCIYSNKVLHHLTQDELALSVERQIDRLNVGGLLCHTFWAGDKEENIQGLRFIYYNEETLNSLIDALCEVIEMVRYTEMDDNDSICLIARKK